MNNLRFDLPDKTRRLVLASQSPRRSELLTRADIRFDLVVPDDTAECGICSRETPPELVARLAYQKAENVVEKLLPEETDSESGTLVLACDTVAECVGMVLGKPTNREHAFEMLDRLRGREHSVYSGICLWHLPSLRRVLNVDRTRLMMDRISDSEINAYLDTGLWEGKAGAFGFQDGPDWIHLIQGSASNVVGLPMEMLSDMLSEFDSSASAAARPATQADS